LAYPLQVETSSARPRGSSFTSIETKIGIAIAIEIEIEIETARRIGSRRLSPGASSAAQTAAQRRRAIQSFVA